MCSPLFIVERVSERPIVDAVVFACVRFDPVVFARARLALSALDRLPMRFSVERCGTMENKCGAMENTRSSSSRASAEVRTSSLARESAVSCEWVGSCDRCESSLGRDWEELVLGWEMEESRGSAAVEAGREAAVEEGREAVEEGRSAVEEGREVVC